MGVNSLLAKITLLKKTCQLDAPDAYHWAQILALHLVRQPLAFFAKYLAEKAKYIDVSQPPHQGDEPKRRQIHAIRTLNRR